MQDQLRAHTKLLNALRETQIDHGDRLGRIEGRMDSLDGRMDSLEGRFDRLESKVEDGFAKVGADQAKVMELLSA